MTSPAYSVHPALRPLLQMVAGKPTMADLPIETLREQMAARTVARGKGPEVDEVHDLAASGPRGDIPLRLYKPRGANGVAVAFHGGGWLMGNIESFDATCRHLANDSGLAVVNVDYRLAPEHPFPAPVEDAWAATQWIAREGKSLGLNTDRLGVMGESAGGNLAAVVCLMARDADAPKIRAQALVYPATDARLQAAALDEFATGYLQTKRDVFRAFRNYGLGALVKADDWRLSPLLAPSHRGLPPALIVSAELDVIRDDSEAYACALQAAETPAVHVRYHGVIHTFYGMRAQLDAAAQAQRQVAHYLRDTLAA